MLIQELIPIGYLIVIEAQVKTCQAFEDLREAQKLLKSLKESIN